MVSPVLHDDWLMRQLNRFALGVAELVAGGTVTEDEDVEEECEALLGAPVSAFESMSVPSLLSMFPILDAGSERRALALAVGLARRAEELGAHGDGARRRSLALLDTLDDDGREMQPEVMALRESLIRRLGGVDGH